MATKIDAKLIHKRLGIKEWLSPKYWGPEKYSFTHRFGNGSLIVSTFEDNDNIEWVHASITRKNHTPTYRDMKMMHKAVFGANWAYQVFAPPEDHVNHHEFALHLWGRVDGKPAIPDFAELFKQLTGIKSI